MYMGRDKHENEVLIRFGWPCDLWFHVDDMSSAHVYLRLPKGFTQDNIPPAVLEDCAQLVKANSIKGNKANNVKIVYTMWSNLKKRRSMAVGQIGFHDTKALKYTKVAERKNEIVNRINKTKKERETAFIKRSWDEMKSKERAQHKKRRKEEAARVQKLKAKEAKEAELREYKSLFDDGNGGSAGANPSSVGGAVEEDMFGGSDDDDDGGDGQTAEDYEDGFL